MSQTFVRRLVLGLALGALGLAVLIALPLIRGAPDAPGAVVQRDHVREFVLVVAVLLSGLAALAAVLKALDLTGPTPDAFGLPAGTIRAFLAIGLLLVLFLFADQQLSALRDQAPRQVAVAQTLAGTPEEVAARYDRAGMVALPRTTAAGATVYDIYERRDDEELSDIAASIINGLLTLVASVVSFYFGARAVQDAASGERAGAGGLVPPDVLGRLAAVRKEHDELKATIERVSATLDSKRAANATSADVIAVDNLLSGAAKDFETDLKQAEEDSLSSAPGQAIRSVTALTGLEQKLATLRELAQKLVGHEAALNALP